MATTAEYPQLSLSRVAPYIAVVLVTFVALVQCIVSFMPELESYGTPVLTWGGTFLLLQIILSLNKEWHVDINGSPFYLCVGNVMVQHIAVPICTFFMLKGWYEKVATGTTTWSEIMYAEWRPSSHSDPEWYWEQTITWVVLCMLLKDLPWLLATVNKVKNANLVFAHHIGCIVGGLLCLHYNAKGARMMAPGFTIVQELGSACYTYISVYPDHRGICLGHFYVTTVSNTLGFAFYVWHLFFTCEMFTAWWWFMTLIGPVVIGVRQRSTFNYRANYLATGNASKATIIEKVK